MLKAALVFQRYVLTTLYSKSLIDVAWGSSCALFTLASVVEPDTEIFVNAWTCFKGLINMLYNPKLNGVLSDNKSSEGAYM